MPAFVVVFFSSKDGAKGPWTPMDRDLLPEWLKDESIIERMLAGEATTNTDDSPTWYSAIAIKRMPEPERRIVLPEPGLMM